MARKRTMPICSTCGSGDVRCDSYSSWDRAAQQWVHTSDHGNEVCENCGGECSVEWIDLTDPRRFPAVLLENGWTRHGDPADDKWMSPDAKTIMIGARTICLDLYIN